MKRDWDLLRKQLTDIEEERDPLADFPDEPKYETQTWEEYEQRIKEFKTIENRIGGHLELLVENGYIDGLQVLRSLDGGLHFGVSNPRLTMTGHDLLDTMRSSTVWNSIKTTTDQRGQARIYFCNELSEVKIMMLTNSNSRPLIPLKTKHGFAISGRK